MFISRYRYVDFFLLILPIERTVSKVINSHRKLFFLYSLTEITFYSHGDLFTELIFFISMKEKLTEYIENIVSYYQITCCL